MAKAAEDLKEISEIEELYIKRKNASKASSKKECPIGSMMLDDEGNMYVCYGVLNGHLLWKSVV